MHTTKLLAYGGTSTINDGNVLLGAVLAPAVICGSLLGKHVVNHIDAALFSSIVDTALLIAGVLLLIG